MRQIGFWLGNLTHVVFGKPNGPIGRLMALLVMLLAAGSGSVLAQTAVSRPAGGPISQEILTITTPDGLQLPAVLSAPAAGYSAANPAIIFLPDGPGLSPLKSSDASRYLAEAMAARGYVALSL